MNLLNLGMAAGLMGSGIAIIPLGMRVRVLLTAGERYECDSVSNALSALVTHLGLTLGLLGQVWLGTLLPDNVLGLPDHGYMKYVIGWQAVCNLYVLCWNMRKSYLIYEFVNA